MSKLTLNQRQMLKDVSARTYSDGSGRGLVMMDGHMARTATSLANRGLVTLPAGHGHYFGGILGVRITDLGRAALEVSP